MSRLAQAVELLDQALADLDAKVERIAAGAGVPGASQQEVEDLREERDALSAEVERLRTENEQLEDFTSDVAGRLDGAIREIRTVLQH
ncbi:MAG: DUF4164 family protein [Alphaproteobacteria bacterium]|nr:DUF4164 family protein [Alphaproteobacteria bacterium]